MRYPLSLWHIYGLTFVDQQIHVLPPWLFNKLQLVELNSPISIFVEHWLIKFNMLIKWANSIVNIIWYTLQQWFVVVQFWVTGFSGGLTLDWLAFFWKWECRIEYVYSTHLTFPFPWVVCRKSVYCLMNSAKFNGLALYKSVWAQLTEHWPSVKGKPRF